MGTWLSGITPGLLDGVWLGLRRALTNIFVMLMVMVVCVTIGVNLCRLLDELLSLLGRRMERAVLTIIG